MTTSSPDLADALALTFGMAEMPRGMAGARGFVGHALSDFDPYDDRSLRRIDRPVDEDDEAGRVIGVDHDPFT